MHLSLTIKCIEEDGMFTASDVSSPVRCSLYTTPY
jgi:hypothetical protein